MPEVTQLGEAELGIEGHVGYGRLHVLICGAKLTPVIWKILRSHLEQSLPSSFYLPHRPTESEP